MIPIPSDDDARIKNLHAFEVLDTPDEDSFDAITRLAARLFAVPIALVSLVDKDRQWFKSSHGLDADQTPRDQAFCTYAIMENEPLVVLDATLDDRFKDNPLVTGELGICFYAGAPLISPELSPRHVLHHRHETTNKLSRVRKKQPDRFCDDHCPHPGNAQTYVAGNRHTRRR